MSEAKITKEGGMWWVKIHQGLLATQAGPFLTRQGAERCKAKTEEEYRVARQNRLDSATEEGYFRKLVPSRPGCYCKVPSNLDETYGDGTVWVCGKCEMEWVVRDGMFETP